MAGERHEYETVVAWTQELQGTLAASITRIVVKPRITIGADTDRSKVERVVKMAEKHCYISNSLNGEVRLEADIIVA